MTAPAPVRCNVHHSRDENHCFQGIPIGSGRASGQAVVLHANEGMAVIPAGVILILPLLSAGFAAAIAQAAGVIAERGGPLSNGANLAREAAVPAVVLENAASLVHAGDLVVVDGASGAVIVQQERNSHHAL